MIVAQLPKLPRNGRKFSIISEGILNINPTILKKIAGTQIQCIVLLVLF